MELVINQVFIIHNKKTKCKNQMSGYTYTAMGKCKLHQFCYHNKLSYKIAKNSYPVRNKYQMNCTGHDLPLGYVEKELKFAFSPIEIT